MQSTVQTSTAPVGGKSWILARRFTGSDANRTSARSRRSALDERWIFATDFTSCGQPRCSHDRAVARQWPSRRWRRIMWVAGNPWTVSETAPMATLPGSAGGLPVRSPDEAEA